MGDGSKYSHAYGQGAMQLMTGDNRRNRHSRGSVNEICSNGLYIEGQGATITFPSTFYLPQSKWSACCFDSYNLWQLRGWISMCYRTRSQVRYQKLRGTTWRRRRFPVSTTRDSVRRASLSITTFTQIPQLPTTWRAKVIILSFYFHSHVIQVVHNVDSMWNCW